MLHDEFTNKSDYLSQRLKDCVFSKIAHSLVFFSCEKVNASSMGKFHGFAFGSNLKR